MLEISWGESSVRWAYKEIFVLLVTWYPKLDWKNLREQRCSRSAAAVQSISWQPTALHWGQRGQQWALWQQQGQREQHGAGAGAVRESFAPERGTKLPEFKRCLDSALRPRVWILGGPGWSWEVDSKPCESFRTWGALILDSIFFFLISVLKLHVWHSGKDINGSSQ